MSESTQQHREAAEKVCLIRGWEITAKNAK
jgi:hypothetical protein